MLKPAHAHKPCVIFIPFLMFCQLQLTSFSSTIQEPPTCQPFCHTVNTNLCSPKCKANFRLPVGRVYVVLCLNGKTFCLFSCIFLHCPRLQALPFLTPINTLTGLSKQSFGVYEMGPLHKLTGSSVAEKTLCTSMNLSVTNRGPQ